MAENLLDYLHLRHQPENVNVRHKESLKLQDKIALFSTRAIGTMYAVYLVIIIMLGWMFWQSTSGKPFDPYPFAFLLFIASAIQVPLMSLIMVGQNLLGKHTEMKAEEEYKTTETIYKDIEKIFIHLDEQDKKMEKQLQLLTEILKKKSN
ncbi:MAG: DUF1003 domain-containing protein [Candidatus Daviesbacteria bacterium]